MKNSKTEERVLKFEASVVLDTAIEEIEGQPYFLYSLLIRRLLVFTPTHPGLHQSITMLVIVPKDVIMREDFSNRSRQTISDSHIHDPGIYVIFALRSSRFLVGCF
ncbi:hypothetical protein Y032_0646g1087 [Ancylostoma ceylanicum]|nr:hypothetical protein Y032_0646g1087 [Ancylostoma ceylanicum]